MDWSHTPDVEACCGHFTQEFPRKRLVNTGSSVVVLLLSSTLQDTLNPKWNSNCQFFIKDLEQDVLCVTVFERDQFSPDGQ